MTVCVLVPPPPAGRWQATQTQPQHKDRDWLAYSQTAYVAHQDYIDDIQEVCLQFPKDMSRKNSSGQTLRQVLVNGAGFEHFAFLLNGCRAINSLGFKDRGILATGTTANEAMHSQFNTCQRAIVQQHQESVAAILQSFSMAKLLAHQLLACSKT